MITEISIENFKSLNHVKLELDRINILIGGNNSGKTSILQAIQFGQIVVIIIPLIQIIIVMEKQY